MTLPEDQFFPQPPPFGPTGVFKRFVSLETLTAAFLKEHYLLGLTFIDESGNEYPDSWYEQKIAVAISHFEHHSQMSVLPNVVENEGHDYYINDYEQFAFIQLYQWPIIETRDTPVVRAVYPTGQYITTFPREWIRPLPMHGQIQLVPTQGTLSQVLLGRGGSYLPIIYQGLGYLPILFQVDYTSGFDTGKVPQLILDAIAKLAAIEVLSVMGDTVRPAGVTSQSLGVDGLNESTGFQNSTEYAPIFSGRIAQYQRELFGDPRLGTDGLFNQLKSFYRGINMVVTV